MDKKITQLYPQPLTRNHPIPFIAMVVEARDGEPTLLSGRPDYDGIFPVARCFDTLTPVLAGDQVAAMDTEQGIVVMSRLRAPDESPYDKLHQAKSLKLQAEEEITLHCGTSSVTLTADGKIVFKGRELNAVSSEAMTLQGKTIDLN